MARGMNFGFSMAAHIGAEASVLHVRFAGESFDVSLAKLNLAADAKDRQVKEALAGHLDLSSDQFNDYVIDRHGNGNLTIRPAAVFG